MRQRAITLTNPPPPEQPCEVCGDKQATKITWLSAVGKRFPGRPLGVIAPCWHCQLGARVVHLAMRRDRCAE